MPTHVIVCKLQIMHDSDTTFAEQNAVDTRASDARETEMARVGLNVEDLVRATQGFVDQ